MIKMPFVSVIMPVRNEGLHIAKTLRAVLAQDYPARLFEVIVVDGCSTDGTREVVTRTVGASHTPIAEVHVLENPRQIVPSAMNIGIAHARGEIIVRVDGHTEIASDYISACVSALERSGADNVGGRMDAVSEGGFGASVAMATSSPFGVGGARFHYSTQEEWVDTVYMGAWRRDLFNRIGGFDEELVRNQDDEFNYRLRKQGGKILLSPSIRSIYTNRSTVCALWRQYFQYGYWKVRILQKHPRQMQLRQFVPPAFVLAVIGGAFLGRFNSIVQQLWLAMMMLYVGVTFIASLMTAARRGWQSMRYLPFIYGILHTSYGCGVLVGLIRFAGRWQAAILPSPENPKPKGDV
jgi:succinoglycan biosynthesis protein ExoA